MALLVNVSKKEEGIFVVSCQGAIDSITYSVLENKLDPVLGLSPTVVVLDMGQVNYISSIGLSVVFKAEKSLKAHNGQLIMINLQPQVKNVFDIIKALPNERVFENMAEVDAYLASIQKRGSQDTDAS